MLAILTIINIKLKKKILRRKDSDFVINLLITRGWDSAIHVHSSIVINCYKIIEHIKILVTKKIIQFFPKVSNSKIHI